MARPMRVSVDGLSELAKIPGWLEDGQREFLGKAADRLADEIAKRAPGGASGSVGRSFRGRTVSDTKAEIVSTHPGAKALERGGRITPKGMGRLSDREIRMKRRSLRFQVGGRTVFVPSVRIGARKYVAKGLRPRSRIVREAYMEAFDTLGPGR